MKKNILLLFILIYPVVLFSQPASGDGTSGNPYSGVIATPWTLSGSQYCSDLTVSGGVFTISAGATLRFGTGNSLTVSGTGSLSAAGNSSNLITFTSSGSSWGHIYFNAPNESNQSVIDYCIIENGDVHTYTDYRGYGGAIHSNYSNLIVSNSTLRNNYAEWGGAIFVNASKNPTIRNCYIYNNQSDRAGGGIYCWNSSSPLIENCIFEANDCLETTKESYTGGGLCAQTGCSIKVLNCTFVNNTTTRSTGASIELYGSTGDVVQNCIFWGNGAHFYRTGTNTVQYNAVQGTAPTGTGNFVLNSSNTGLNPSGPFFEATDGSDWSIKVVSPCRDAGTTPSPAVPNDYAGTARLRSYDIGAYEVQYNYWLTSASSTDWATPGNWNGGVPTSSQDIVITTGATNYPTGSTSLDYTVGAGYGLVLEPGAKATFNTLTKTGDLKLMSDNSATSSLITNNSVSPIVELYLTGGGGTAYKWHYISSPVSALPVSTFILKPTMDFAQWIEARPSSDMNQGWVGYDGYLYYGGGDDNNYDISAGNLNVGQGYNYYYSTDNKFSFSGSINVNSSSPAITYGGDETFHGFNLLGNPFPAGLDWDFIIDDDLNNVPFPTNTSKGLYFTRNNTQCSYVGGVGYPDEFVTGVIPPMQGFFIRTANTSTTITLDAEARVHNVPARYKGKNSIPLIRLQLDNDSIKDNTVVRFDSKASSVLDNEFDAVRMFLSESVQYIYSTDGVSKYAINGQPFPETMVQIPLSINVLNSGNHSITATQLQGLESYNIGLKDNITGFTADLKSNPTILFSSDPGIFTGRFVLVISGTTTALPEYPDASEIAFNIYHYQNMLNIQTKGDEWDGSQGSVRVLDLTGRTVTTDANVEFSSNSVIQVRAPVVKGIYVVEISSGAKRYVGKVVVK